MHALTCTVLDRDIDAYALIPTYYDPSKFIAAKVYIENVYHSDYFIFYHCIIKELLDDITVVLQTLPTCLLRTIDRRTGRVALQHPTLLQFDLTKQAILTSLQSWQKDFILDIPAPFVAKDEADFDKLKKDTALFFEQMLRNINKH
jgi:hypothetical protein